ncbi:MAG: hypothetical protein HZC16_01700 [Candidatus Omnitrophica bacterium]|nr:hypothetical protein [Candidatus Omnitrophota bacterium]
MGNKTINQWLPIHLERYLNLGSHYDEILSRIERDPTLQKHINNESFLISKKPGISYVTEQICPQITENRIPIVLLFSNPHPVSLLKGIFLSGVRRFWKSMQQSGMLNFDSLINTPTVETMEQLLKLKYGSEFVFYFYCFFDFPSRYPQQLPEFFGEEFFNKCYLKKSYIELSRFLDLCRAKHIICFGQQAFVYISKRSEDGNAIGKEIKLYTKEIAKAGYILSNLNSKFEGHKDIKLYLTYPTGQGEYNRANSLCKIKQFIKNNI